MTVLLMRPSTRHEDIGPAEATPSPGVQVFLRWPSLAPEIRRCADVATVAGMVIIGGWMSGGIFDLTGSYRAAFLEAIA
jgi:hypothetical protein